MKYSNNKVNQIPSSAGGNLVSWVGKNQVNGSPDSLLFDNSKWLKTKEAAEYLRTSPKQVRKWVYQGRVKAYKLLGKSLRFKKTELDFLLEGGRNWE